MCRLALLDWLVLHMKSQSLLCLISVSYISFNGCMIVIPHEINQFRTIRF